MKRYAGKNTKTEDLWSILSEESGIKVSSMMNDWTKKKGYPVISVKINNHILEFEQVLSLIPTAVLLCMRRLALKFHNCNSHLYYLKTSNSVPRLQSQFQTSGKNDDGQWIVPITLCVGSYDRRKNFLLETKLGKVEISDLLCSNHGKSSSFDEKHEGNVADQLWIKVNIDQSGFYRVNYEDELDLRLRKAVVNNLLSATDKFGEYHTILYQF